MTPYSDKIWSQLGRVMTSCHQCSTKPLHVGLGQFNSKLGIAAQFKFQNWNGIEIDNLEMEMEMLELKTMSMELKFCNCCCITL